MSDEWRTAEIWGYPTGGHVLTFGVCTADEDGDVMRENEYSTWIPGEPTIERRPGVLHMAWTDAIGRPCYEDVDEIRDGRGHEGRPWDAEWIYPRGARWTPSIRTYTTSS